MSYHLTEDQQRVAKNADAFADEFLEPIAADLDRNGNYPKAVIVELAKHNLLGLAVSGFASHVQAVHSLSQVCPAVGSILNNHGVASYVIGKWGKPAQKSPQLDTLTEGEALAALAIYERGTAFGIGPDALVGVEAGGKITLKGKKSYVRNAGVADIYVVFASLPGEQGKTSVAAFIVNAKTPGLSVGLTERTMGLRGCPVAELTFENVVLDASARLGTTQEGATILGETLATYALGEAAQTVGIGRAAAKHAAAAARHRVQFGHPIFSLQAIQTLLAEIASDTHLAWLGVQDAAQLVEDGAPFMTEAAMIKCFIGRFGQKILIDAIQVEGGMGICERVPPHFSGTLPLARLFRDIAGTTLLEAPGEFPEAVVANSL